VTLRKVDLVSDTTTCDVRFTLPANKPNGAADALDAHMGATVTGANSAVNARGRR